MLVSLNWLNEYVDIADISVGELRKKMSSAGLSVERQHEIGTGIEKIVIGEIKEKVAHPDSDHLWVTKVIIGEMNDGQDAVLQIVTGAQNIEVGDKVPVIMPGCKLPDGHEIEVSKLRGIESQGMMCSAKELGVGEDHEGILILDKTIKPGELFAQKYGFPDLVFDIEITPNRGDLLSMVGIAREVGVLFGRDVRLPKTKNLYDARQIRLEDSKMLSLAVQIEDKKDCDRFAVAGFSGDFSVSSPFYIRKRLWAAGMRSISLLVDVSNYVMLELGQPNHAYDASKVSKGEFYVRRAHFGEKLNLLDGSEIELDVHNLVISDGEKILGLAGIMGGDATKIAPDTQQIVVEAAHFDGVVIRKTTMQKQIRSEASHRFERKVDAALPVTAIERYYALLTECTDLVLSGHLVDENHVQYVEREVVLSSALLRTYLGKDLALTYVERVLTSLGFDTLEATHSGEHGGWHIRVSVPSSRQADVAIEEDLIEEVARIYGYENIHSSTPKGAIPATIKNAFVENKEKLIRLLVAQGWQELMTYSFTDKDQILEAGYQIENAVKVHNPLSIEHGYMRMSLLPNLLQLVKKNSYMRKSMAVFECSRVYHQKLYPSLPQEFVNESLEREYLGMVWYEQNFDLDSGRNIITKALTDVFSLFELKNIKFTQDIELNKKLQISKMFHPGRMVAVTLDNLVLGYVGQIHPKLRDQLDLESDVMLAELDLASVLSVEYQAKTFTQFSVFPKTTLSLSFFLDGKINVGKLVDVMRNADSRVKSVSVQSVFRDESMVEDQKKVTFEVILQSETAELSKVESETIRQILINKVAEDTQI